MAQNSRADLVLAARRKNKRVSFAERIHVHYCCRDGGYPLE